MRITNSMMVDSLLANLNAGLARVSKYTDQLSSNKKMNHLSDDPIGVLNSMNARQKLQRLSQYQSNLTSATSWVDQTDTVLSDMNSIITTVQEKVTQAATDTNNPSDKQNIGTLVSQLKDELMQLANSSIGDKYLFAGYNSTTAPFTKDSSGNVLYNGIDLTTNDTTPVLGSSIADTSNATGFTWSGPISADPDKYSITANGDTITVENSDGVQVLSKQITTASGSNTLDLSAQGLGKITWTDNGSATGSEVASAIASAGTVTTAIGEEASQNVKMVVGFNMDMNVTFTGPDVVGTGDDNMFKVMDSIVSALNNNASPDTISACLTKLSNVQDRILQKQVEVGARANKIDTLDNRYSKDVINYTTIKSDAEDIDQAQTITDYKMSEAVYEQALAVGAKIITPTLMDFLK
jgi:flagellar hook-associated protein 3 FlgL